MPQNLTTKSSNDGFCIKDAYVEVSHDHDGTPGNVAAANWFEVPVTLSISLAFEDSNESEVRSSGDGGNFVSPCGTSSKTRTYTVNYLPLRNAPVEWFCADGATYWFRIVFGKTDAAATDDGKFHHRFQAKFEKQGLNLDNNSRDVRQETYTLSPLSVVTETVPTQTEAGTSGFPLLA